MMEEFARQFGLTRLSLDDKEKLSPFYGSPVEPLAEHSFTSAFVWGKTLDLNWGVLHNHLCLFAGDKSGVSLFLPPLPGPGATKKDLFEAVLQSFEIMDGFNVQVGDRTQSMIEYVSEEQLSRLSETDGLGLKAEVMAEDYIYATQRLIELSGNDLKSKRHARGKFVKTYPDLRTEHFEDRHREACIALLDLWCHHGDGREGVDPAELAVAQKLRQRDHAATVAALSHWNELHLSGLVLYVGDVLVGFTLGEILSPKQFSILIEKTHPDFPGAAQFIFSEFCRQCWQDYPECNVGDDWGLPGLRFTKQSYRPIRLQKKFILRRP